MNQSDLRVEMMRIQKKHGKLTAQLVVEEARPKRSRLHAQFEWDDAAGAERYREIQARGLIRVVRVHRQSPDEPKVRAWHSAHQLGEGPGYVPMEEVAQDPDRAQLAMAQMQREMESLLRRWGERADFFENWDRQVERFWNQHREAKVRA